MAVETVKYVFEVDRSSVRRTDAIMGRLQVQEDRLRKGAERLGDTLGKGLRAGSDRAADGIRKLTRASMEFGKQSAKRLAETLTGMRRLRKETDDTEKRVGRLGRAFKSIGQGIALGIGGRIAGIATDMIGQAVSAPERIRAQADAAAKSANLAVDEYGRLKHSAELSGSSINTVDKATRNLTKVLGKKLSPDVSKALESIGLSADDLRKARPEKQLGMIGDALKGIEDPAERVRIAGTLLGEKFGPELTPLLEAGSAGLRAMGDEAAELGLVFSADTASAAERLGDAQDKLKKRFEGVLNTVAARAIPLFADLTEGIVDFVKNNRELIDGALNRALDFVANSAQKVWKWIGEVDWAGVWDKITSLADTIWKVGEALYNMVDALGAGNVALATMALKVGALLGPWGLLATAAVAAGAAIAKAFGTANAHLETTIARVYEVRAAASDTEIKRHEAEIQAADDRMARAQRIEDRLTAAASTIGGGKVDGKTRAQILRMSAIAGDRNATREQLAEVRATLDTMEAQAAEKAAAGGGKGTKGGRKGGKSAAPSAAFGGAVDAAIKAAAEREAYNAAAKTAAEGGSMDLQRQVADRTLRETTKRLQGDQAFSRQVLAEEARRRQQEALQGRVTGAFGAVGGAEAVRLDVGAGAGAAPAMSITTTKVDVQPGAVQVTGNEFAADMPTLERALNETVTKRLGQAIGTGIAAARSPWRA